MKAESGTTDASDTPSRILVPTDGSANAFRAVEVAVEMSRRYDAELVVLSVVPQPGAFVTVPAGLGTSPTAVESYYGQQEKDSAVFVDGALKLARSHGVARARGEVVRAERSVSAEIVEFAGRQKVDLVVIGTRGLGGLSRLLQGSVSSEVVVHARCNVLVVR